MTPRPRHPVAASRADSWPGRPARALDAPAARAGGCVALPRRSGETPKPRRHRATAHGAARRRAVALPAVLLFLTVAFGAWAVLYRGSASVLRVEQARTLRESRNTWTAPAMAAALRLLETGTPPADPYACKLTLTQQGQTRYFRLSFESIGIVRWTVTAAPTDTDDLAPDAPSTFAIPDAPTGLVATALSSSQIALTWSDVEADTGYQVERSPDGPTGWTLIGTTVANDSAFTDTGLSGNTAYYYRVRATGEIAAGPYSAVASATTLNAPAAPTGLVATVLSPTSVRLDWSDHANNEIGFRVQRSSDGGSTWSNSGIASANATTHTLAGLTSGITYHFRVRATGAGADSDWSNVATAVPQ